jgi:hypothetical protein
MSDKYRIHLAAVKTASLNADSVMGCIACDRDAVLEEVVIASRTGITKDNTNYSKIKIRNGSNVLFSREFNDAGGTLDALKNESLAPLKDSTVTPTTCLEVRYEYGGNGTTGGIDLDCIFVFRPSRG